MTAAGCPGHPHRTLSNGNVRYGSKESKDPNGLLATAQAKLKISKTRD
jgi:hypothetical protein